MIIVFEIELIFGKLSEFEIILGECVVELIRGFIVFVWWLMFFNIWFVGLFCDLFGGIKCCWFVLFLFLWIVFSLVVCELGLLFVICFFSCVGEFGSSGNLIVIGSRFMINSLR